MCGDVWGVLRCVLMVVWLSPNSIMLDKRFRTECAPAKFSFPTPNRYETILKQRHVQVRSWGRSHVGEVMGRITCGWGHGGRWLGSHLGD